MTRLPALATTAIGSLPHTQLELAVQAAFQVDVPYLPQLPRRDPGEYMVPQALEGLPGLSHDREGVCTVSLSDWRVGASALQRLIGRSLAGEAALLEPTPEAYGAWPAFLWELSARKTPIAKVHLAGPLTVTHAARLSDGRALASDAALASQVFQLVVARALAMVKAVAARGAQALFFFDEPGLCGLSLGTASHLMALQELKVAALALRKAGAIVGLHCCGNTDWERLLPLGFEVLSIDARLSLAPLLERERELAVFLRGGGRLALGVVPTDLESELPSATALCHEIFSTLSRAGAEEVLERALLTPACGLALRGVPEAEVIFERLAHVRALLAARASLT